MKVALVYGGQARFTPAFPICLQQIKGADQIDLYLYLWASDWAQTAQQARAKLGLLLPPNVNLKKLVVEPDPELPPLPPHELEHTVEEHATILWWWRRRYGMWTSIKRAVELIDEDYDVVVKFRGDGRLDRDIDINTIDISQGLVVPENSRCGVIEGQRVSDQFGIGTLADVRFFASLIDYMYEYITEYPNWETDGHCWASEIMLGKHYFNNNRQQINGDFQYMLKSEGRSHFDDKHLHHPVTQVLR